MRARAGLWLIVAIAAAHLAAALWITRGGVPLPPDALEYAEVARNLVRGRGYTINLVEIHPGLLPSVRHLHELHGLLRPFVLAPLFALFGPEARLVRVPGLVFLSLTYAATFGLSRAVAGPLAAGLAVALVMLRGGVALDALLGGDDVGWMLFSLLSVWAFLRGRAEGGGRTRTRLALGAGLAAALATAEKLSGVVLPIALVTTSLVADWAVRWRHGRTPGRATTVLLEQVLIAAPTGLVVLAYALRNHALHGGYGFRYSALDWLSRADPFAYFAYHADPPELLAVLRSLGPGRVAELTLAQARLLGTVILDDPVLLVLGPLSLGLIWKKAPELALLGLLYTASTVVVVCFAYHVETRYLFALYPLYAVAIATTLVDALRRISERMAPRRARALLSAAVLCAAVLLAAGTSGLMSLYTSVADRGRSPLPCEDAVRYLEDHAGPDEPILTSTPWYLTWAADRPSVMVPTNGVPALVTVALHYGAWWAMDGAFSYGAADVRADMAALAGDEEPLRSELAFRGSQCSVYRLRPAE